MCSKIGPATEQRGAISWFFTPKLKCKMLSKAFAQIYSFVYPTLAASSLVKRKGFLAKSCSTSPSSLPYHCLSLPGEGYSCSMIYFWFQLCWILNCLNSGQRSVNVSGPFFPLRQRTPCFFFLVVWGFRPPCPLLRIHLVEDLRCPRDSLFL